MDVPSILDMGKKERIKIVPPINRYSLILVPIRIGYSCSK